MRKPRRPCQNAFSLVEVVIAIGITSFVVIALLGLASSVLDRAKDSKIDTLWVNMLQDVTTQMRGKKWVDLKDGDFYYDAEGGRLSSSVGAAYQCIVTQVETPETSDVSLGPALKVFLITLKWPVGSPSAKSLKTSISIARYE